MVMCWLGRQLILYILKVYLVIGTLFLMSYIVTERGFGIWVRQKSSKRLSRTS